MENHSVRLGIKVRCEACVLATLRSTKGAQNDVQKVRRKTSRLGVLEEANDSKYVAPSFYQPKEKTNRVRLLGNIRKFNRQLKRKP